MPTLYGSWLSQNKSQLETGDREIMSGGVEGFGNTTCWGFSPALDLAAVAPTPGEPPGGKETRGGSGVEGHSPEHLCYKRCPEYFAASCNWI